MKKNKEDREMFFDNQAYFSGPMIPPFQSNNLMYYNTPNMMPYSNTYQPQGYYGNYNSYDNNIESRVNKLERVVRRLEERVTNLEKNITQNQTFQTTDNNYSNNNDTYMV